MICKSETMASSYRNSRPPWRSPSQNYTSTVPERPSTLNTNPNRFLSGSSYRALTGNSALPTRAAYGEASSVTALKDKFSSMARDKAVLADKRMRAASSGFGHKPTPRTGSAGRFGAPAVRSPVKEQSVTVFGVCNVPDVGTETHVDITVSVVTRATSPTPPAHSNFLRSKHAGQQEFTVSMVPRKYEAGVDVNVQTDERFLRNMPSLKIVSAIPVARYIGGRSGYSCSKSKDSGSTSDNSGQEQDSCLSDSSSHTKSRSSGAETSKLPQPNWTRNRCSEKNREESGTSRSPSFTSSTAEEKPPTGRKTDEPKLVTVRSIAPVTGVAVISEAPKLQYPLRKMDSCDQVWWLQDSEKDDHDGEELDASSVDVDLNMNNTRVSKIPSYGIRKMDSSDRNRWLQEAEQTVNDEEPSRADSISCSESTMSASTSSRSRAYGVRKTDSSDRNRWLQEAAREDIVCEKAKSCVSSISNPESIKSDALSSTSPAYDVGRAGRNVRDSVSGADSASSGGSDLWPTENQTYRVRRMDSSDAPWWLNDQSPREDSKSGSCKTDSVKSDRSPTRSPEMTASYGVRRMDSFDSPWWLSGDEVKPLNPSSTEDPANACASHGPFPIIDPGNGRARSDADEAVDCSRDGPDGSEYSSPDWWGECGRGDGLVRAGRTAPRTDDAVCRTRPDLQDELDRLMLFIGGCRNIDELLGDEEPPPAAPTTPPDTDSDDCVEVAADQVRIHDSTAQLSTIQTKLTTTRGKPTRQGDRVGSPYF